MAQGVNNHTNDRSADNGIRGGYTSCQGQASDEVETVEECFQ